MCCQPPTWLGIWLQDDGLELQYRSCYVRILDSKRKFVEAAQRYHELSQMQNKQVQSGQDTARTTCLLSPM
jgi:hypothetical protein